MLPYCDDFLLINLKQYSVSSLDKENSRFSSANIMAFILFHTWTAFSWNCLRYLCFFVQAVFDYEQRSLFLVIYSNTSIFDVTFVFFNPIVVKCWLLISCVLGILEEIDRWLYIINKWKIIYVSTQGPSPSFALKESHLYV